MPEYSKFKERKPEDTVFEIQKILNRIGLFPVVNWTPRSYEGARSNRITLYPTSLGTNGKGTDELYCSASGYGELIERLSNQMLPIRDRMDDVFPEVGFHEFPDEKVMTISEILAFSSQSYFIRCFRNAAGITPAEYRRRYYAKAMKAADGIPEQDGRDGEGADAWHPGSYPTNKRSDKQEGTL